jgi:hypothetical protein
MLDKNGIYDSNLCSRLQGKAKFLKGAIFLGHSGPRRGSEREEIKRGISWAHGENVVVYCL